MLTFTANDAKNKFGEVIDAALQSPVSITKHNRRTVVVLSDAEYRNLVRMGHDRLMAEVKAGFDQLDRGEVASRTTRQIAHDVRRQFLDGKL
jgi:prevent-host-death family protein